MSRLFIHHVVTKSCVYLERNCEIIENMSIFQIHIYINAKKISLLYVLLKKIIGFEIKVCLILYCSLGDPKTAAYRGRGGG